MEEPTSVNRYINPLTDFGFKHIFGRETNKDLLINFLNSILPRRHLIQSLEYGKQEFGGLTAEDRKAILDIHCIVENGDKVIIELQRAKQEYFIDRTLYYTAFPIIEQAVKSKWDFALNAVYTISILDFELENFNNDENLKHVITLKDERNNVFYEKLSLIYIELPKFTKKIDEIETDFDKWLFVLRNTYQLEHKPLNLNSEVMNKFFETAELARLPIDERIAYERSIKSYRDNHNIIEQNKEKIRIAQLELQKERRLLKKAKAEKEEANAQKEEANAQRKEANAQREEANAQREEANAQREKERTQKIEAVKLLIENGVEIDLISKKIGLSVDDIILIVESK